MIEIAFYLLLFLISYPLVLYPLSLFLVSKFYKEEVIEVDYDFNPEVSLIIAAYNEEKVIIDKLNNVLEMEYPSDKLEIIVASDGSSDRTNQLVAEFIESEPNHNISLLDVQGRRGKTHAQNEAVKACHHEMVVFSDSNSIWDKEALRFLVNRFKNDKIGYLSGRLQYVKSGGNITTESESTYWSFDLKLRALESQIGSTVGGNGAIYAIRKKNYVNLPDILSHDGFMPTKMVLQGMLAKFEPSAIAYEKAGKTAEDEFKRKVRMQRGQPWKKYVDIQKFNIFKYGWFSYFYVGHKFLKYLLYLFHPLLFAANFALISNRHYYLALFLCHSLFYILAFVGLLSKSRKKIFYFPYYYTMTIVAQGYSVIKTLTGNAKATWEKAESTR